MNPIKPVPSSEVNPDEFLKERAHSILDARRSALVRLAQVALLRILLEQKAATADDVRPLVPVPSGISPKFFGAAPGPLARAGIIRADGFHKSNRKEAHVRPNRIWKLIDRTAAQKWPTNNSPPSDQLSAAGPEIPPSGSNTAEAAP